MSFDMGSFYNQTLCKPKKSIRQIGATITSILKKETWKELL